MAAPLHSLQQKKGKKKRKKEKKNWPVYIGKEVEVDGNHHHGNANREVNI